MIIDTHIHAFTDKVAEIAIPKLAKTSGLKPTTDGTVKSAVALLDEDSIDYGVVLPIATKPTQQTTINNWAKEIYKDKIISFGTVHPEAEDVIEELERIKDLGLKGVKLHNDYQGVFIFDDINLKMYKKIEELGLPVVFHMGYDPISPKVHRAMPYDLLWLHDKFPKLKIIGAHMGGVSAWESVYFYLAGVENIYLDTAFVAGRIPEELYLKIIKKHGTDRILFGSDLPWSRPSAEKEIIEKLPLSSQEVEKIFYKNAVELLKLF